MAFAYRGAENTPADERAVQSPPGPAVAAEPATSSGASDRLANAAASPQGPPDAPTTVSSFRLAAEAWLEAERLRPTPVEGVSRGMASVATGDVLAPRPPDVHISIGRVEVHAVQARAAVARSTPVRRPQLSLADYLAQRK